MTGFPHSIYHPTVTSYRPLRCRIVSA
jgi:hypothetical protein